MGGTYVQDWTQSQKFASKLFSQCWQKRFIGNCCPKCMEEIANISRITNSTRIARLRYLQVSVSENFLVNHFFAKIAKKSWLANLCDCVKSWTYLLGWWGQSKRARPSCSKGEQRYPMDSVVGFPNTTIPSLVKYNLNTIPCALEHTLMQTFC